MEKKNNSLVIILMGVIIVILAALCVLFATDTINLKSNESNNQEVENQNNSQQNDENISQNDKNNSKEVTISKNVMDKYFSDVFYGHKAPYCGEGIYDLVEGNSKPYYITENGYSYLPSIEYKSKSELINYFKSYLSNDFIKKIINDENYFEKDNKLYCLTPNKGSLVYVKENSIYEVIEVTENKIIGKGTVAYYATDAELTLIANFTLIKENNNWVLDNYSEEL